MSDQGGPRPRRYSLRFESALRRAAEWHRVQMRKGSSIPYLTHLVAVALILDRHGFDEDVLIAGLLHDAHEDAQVAIDRIAAEFGPAVAAIVAACSERKADEAGHPRPWRDRKRELLDRLPTLGNEAKAVLLADKLHNLTSMLADLEDPALSAGLWTKFNAPPADLLWYHAASLDACAGDDPRLSTLAAEARDALAAVSLAWGDAAKSRRDH